MQDYLQAGLLSKVVGGQIVNEPKQLLRMTLFMRSATAGSMFVSSYMGIQAYNLLFQLAKLMSPAHEALLEPFPGLLYRWRCLVGHLPTSSFSLISHSLSCHLSYSEFIPKWFASFLHMRKDLACALCTQAAHITASA